MLSFFFQPPYKQKIEVFRWAAEKEEEDVFGPGSWEDFWKTDDDDDDDGGWIKAS